MLTGSEAEQPFTALPTWQGLRASDLWRWPLPALPAAGDRILTRLVGLLALRQISTIEGWGQILPARDPFLLVANHSSRREAVLLPVVLLLARGGRQVRFLADWNFRLIPGVGHLYDRAGAITLTRKPAHPRFLNALKPWFEPPRPAHDEARRHLLRGGAVGIFPEGRVNRDAARLLPGRRGAARLSLELQAPVVPVGIRFGRRDRARGQVDTRSPMTVRFGPALRPPGCSRLPPSTAKVAAWHALLMTEIGELCGKRWAGAANAQRG